MSGSKVDYSAEVSRLDSLWAGDENPVAITSQCRQRSEPLPLHIRCAVDTPFRSAWSGGYTASEQVGIDPFSQEGMDPMVEAMMTANEDDSHFRTQQSSSPFYPVCGAANGATLGEQGRQHSTPQTITSSRPGAGLEWTEPLQCGGRWHTSHVQTVDAPLVHDLVGQAGHAVVDPAASRWWIDNPALQLLTVDSCPVTSKLSRDPFPTGRGPPICALSGGGEQVSLDQWRIPPAPSGGIGAALAAAKVSAAAVAAAMEMPWMQNGGELPAAEDVAALSTRPSHDLVCYSAKNSKIMFMN